MFPFFFFQKYSGMLVLSFSHRHRVFRERKTYLLSIKLVQMFLKTMHSIDYVEYNIT